MQIVTLNVSHNADETFSHDWHMRKPDRHLSLAAMSLSASAAAWHLSGNLARRETSSILSSGARGARVAAQSAKRTERPATAADKTFVTAVADAAVEADAEIEVVSELMT